MTLPAAQGDGLSTRGFWRLGLTLAALLALVAPGASAQSVTLSGSLGSDKVLLIIDGHPQTLAVGASARGVTLRRIGPGEADVEVGGKIQTLRLGDAPARLVGDAVGRTQGTQIVLAAGSGGHFFAAGAINGRAVQFVVDTGATSVAISQGEAERLGLDWRSGQRGMAATAGGAVVAHALNLNSVRIGDVEVFNVAAVVIPADMPAILLGNSFLSRFSMHRDSDVMRLEKRR
jgi:aspartyl protease family protein